MDTITLADALAGFTSNESSALGAYIGTNGKQSAAALAKVVGEQRTDLTGNEDLNNITTSGVYMAYSSTETTTIGHMPATGYGIRLEVVPLRRDNTQLMQILYMANANIDTYVRRYNNGSWNDWKQVTKSWEVGGQYGNIPANSDLNYFIDIGVYRINTNITASSIANNPSGTWGRLDVMVFLGGSSRLQIFTSYTNPPRIWVRRSTDGVSWGSWSELAKVD